MPNAGAGALDNLEKEYARSGHESLYEQLGIAPGTSALRNHPRVKALRTKLGLGY
jgi:hypothetical protein